jgi:SAM-dependent methyltransferase
MTTKSEIEASRERAIVRDRWFEGDRWQRIGMPWQWVDGGRIDPAVMLGEPYSFLQALSMFYEEYPVPAVLASAVPEHAAVLQQVESLLSSAVRRLFPFGDWSEKMRNAVRCTALARTQDYCTLQYYCSDLVQSGQPVHLDIGPGLGSHAAYSLSTLGTSTFLGVDVDPSMYSAQRCFFSLIADPDRPYFDPIVAEGLAAQHSEVVHEMKNFDAHSIIHVPGWHLSAVPDRSIDFITATFVLNEVNAAGIVWLLTHMLRCLRQDGCVLIRDSERLKPNRHSLNYDQALLDLGFSLEGRLDIRHRVDMLGIPRVYRKTGSRGALEFEEVYEYFFGRNSITAHGGEFVQNVSVRRGEETR